MTAPDPTPLSRQARRGEGSSAKLRVRGASAERREMSQASSEEVAPIEPLRDEHGRSLVSTRLLRRARVVAEALFLTSAGPVPAARIDWLIAELEDFLARAGAKTRFVFGLALLAVSILAPLYSLKVTALARMPVAARARVLGHLEDKLGAPVLAVKALLCVLYYEHPDAARSIGFDGACVKQQLGYR